MRIRTLFATVVGATAGAGTMFLLDPERGRARRRELVRSAVTRGRAGVAVGSRELGQRAGERARRSIADVRAGFAAGLDEAGGTDRPDA